MHLVGISLDNWELELTMARVYRDFWMLHVWRVSRRKMVSCGARHSAILTVDGQVFSWGWNKYGQLGVGDSMDRNIPSQVPIEGCRPKSVACGWWHTLLLAETPLKS
ncbi:hypothetical protein OIU84_011194 [Salix udensis]|uniref:Uncharacterized protein n=1 Tax=Salix udensis TaxID=889485 RepID=A0AAD6JN52_9ROSI|nr:hypothetical protein OIU84_011194 [Salix udensis]